MTTVPPTLGRIVLVTLSAEQAQMIRGNAKAGAEAPAIVVAAHGTTIDVVILGNGPTTLWATSLEFGTGPRTWRWPPRVAEGEVSGA